MSLYRDDRKELMKRRGGGGDHHYCCPLRFRARENNQVHWHVSTCPGRELLFNMLVTAQSQKERHNISQLKAEFYSCLPLISVFFSKDY